MKFLEIIKSDLFRYAGRTGMKDFVTQYFSSAGFKFTFWMRACSFARKNKFTKYTIFVLMLPIYKHYKYKYGIDISYGANIGPGLLIYHFGGIVFAAKSAGKNLTLSQCTTTGMTIHDGVKEYPVIGDNVYLAPGAKVIGGITVGNNVAIGSNCVLNKSVENCSVVVGVPGKIVSYRGSSEYVNNPI